MKDSLREELIKEYEMLIEKSMGEIEKEQVKIVIDDIKAKELAILYIKALKDYIRKDYEEGEKTVNNYLEKIMEMRNIQEKDHMETLKNDMCEMIKQGIIRIDEPIKKFCNHKSYYDDILKDKTCLEKDLVEINKEKEELTNKELDIFKSFTSEILNEINSEIKKITKDTDKSMMKSVLKGVAWSLAPVAGVFLLRKSGRKVSEKVKEVEKATKVGIEVAKILYQIKFKDKEDIKILGALYR